MALQNVTLEISSKPFRDESEETMFREIRRMFSQWRMLCEAADQVSVMLWLGDGSEILEYTGNLDDKFEWGYWFGVANAVPLGGTHHERIKFNTHHFPEKYDANAAPRPYRWLKRLNEVIREVGREMFGKPIRVGDTFDNGPEFAISDFKYRRHPEVMLGDTAYPHSNIVCNTRLHADKYRYAAFPDGIPENTSVGTFLGAQYKIFARDLDFDFIWLSNGMGFGLETWGITGQLFDLEKWHPEKADAATKTMLEFWRDFTAACPDMEIETRGSNLSAGVEICTDAAPLKELYAEGTIAPPVNSPWAALNYKTGLEIAAWMSHTAELPGKRMMYRFYAHDPWFLNSPWLDRYGRSPWDIYQPLSVCRLNGEGKAEAANSVNILSVDDSFGQMPPRVPREVIPHLLAALEDEAPDASGPLVWVYPFDEYTAMCRGAAGRPDIVFAEDQFVGEAIQAGLPLNTVISTGNFRKVMAAGGAALAGTIKVIPVSAAAAVLPYLKDCGDVMFYGTLENAPAELRELLGLDLGTPLAGECRITSQIPGDLYASGKVADRCCVFPQFTAGGLGEILRPGGGARVLAEASRDGEKRVIASIRELPGGQKIGFVRAVYPLHPDKPALDRLLLIDLPDQGFPTMALPRQMLAEFGWTVRGSARAVASELPRTNISRSGGAFFYSVFARDSSYDLLLGSPLGAPIPTERETRVVDSIAYCRPEKFSRYECRAFVKQAADSVVSCKIGTAEVPYFHGMLNYSGLVDAEVRFFPPLGPGARLEAFLTPELEGWWMTLERTPDPVAWEDTPYGRCAVMRHVNGTVRFAW